MSIVVTIPEPPRVLHPNARPHFMAKANAAKKYRATCKVLALAASRNTRPMLKAPTVRIVWKLGKGRKRVDPDNALSSLKAAWDGLCDAGVFDGDRSVRYEPIEFVRNTRPWSEIVVEVA